MTATNHLLQQILTTEGAAFPRAEQTATAPSFMTNPGRALPRPIASPSATADSSRIRFGAAARLPVGRPLATLG